MVQVNGVVAEPLLQQNNIFLGGSVQSYNQHQFCVHVCAVGIEDIENVQSNLKSQAQRKYITEYHKIVTARMKSKLT